MLIRALPVLPASHNPYRFPKPPELSWGRFEQVCVGLPDGDQLAEVQLIVINLSDKDGRHGLVQCRAVHVDGGAHGEDEAGDLSVNMAVFQQTLHGDGQRGRAEKRFE